MSKFKFVKLNVRSVQNYPSGQRECKWFEWFCLDETWCHPYNRGTPRAKEFQDWCKKHWQAGHKDCYSPICPEIKIGGQRLNDGWGSDVVGRIACFFEEARYGVEGEIADAVETAMSTGEVQSVLKKSEDGLTELEVTVEPFESVELDADSVRDFGPYAEDALEGLVADPKSWLAAR